MLNKLTSRILTNDEIFKLAPSVMTTEPDHTSVSERYAFIPTLRVVDTLRNAGWLPVAASQTKSRTVEGRSFARHLMRFRHASTVEALQSGNEIGLGESIPELVLRNSHDGSGSFEFWAGVFRLVCSNGLIVASHSFARARVRHVGYADSKVIDAQGLILESAPRVLREINAMQALTLEAPEQRAFARSALALRYSERPGEDTQSADGRPASLQAPIEPEQLLTVRRNADAGPSLWQTFNRVQENLIRGGLPGIGSTGRRARTRAVNAVNENVRLNTALWTLAAEMLKIKGAASAEAA